ncbi:hypothetical protein evm_011103 [Chilo suppressalis]|nr:hypothetical protein evm_011103 [Chilo suppressalis]
MHMQEICSNYKYGKSIGNLCADLCGPDGISSISCHTFYKEKDQVFSGIWRNYSLIFKSSKQVTHLKESLLQSEDKFTLLIRNNVKLRFNISIDTVDAKRMSLIQYNQKGLSRYIEKENAWSLLQSNEYLALTLYEKYDIFPKLFGSCGTIYAVQKLNTVTGFWLSMTFSDSRDDWQRRVRISLMILDYLLLLEERLPEPLHLCDIRLNNFGVTDDFKKVMYLDLDSVHPASVANSFTGNGAKCMKHSDCDHFDCRSFCNLITFKCQFGVVNNNLQMVCERIFLGWVLSGKMMVPGLLLGPRTPRVLTELLEICANPVSESGTPRAPAKKDIRNRLYDLLTHLV